MIVLNVYWAYKNFVKQWRVVWVVTLSEEEENEAMEVQWLFDDSKISWSVGNNVMMVADATCFWTIETIVQLFERICS